MDSGEALRVPKGSGQDPEHNDASRTTRSLWLTLGTRGRTHGGLRRVKEKERSGERRGFQGIETSEGRRE
jgi:hypothetical protein